MNKLSKSIVALLMFLFATSVWSDTVVVVSASSAVESLTKSQVSDIFLGKSSSFPDGSKAVAMDQKDGLDIRKDFYKKVTGKSASQLKSYWSRLIFSGKGQPPKQLADSVAVKQSLSSNQNQISYIQEEQLDDKVKVVLKL